VGRFQAINLEVNSLLCKQLGIAIVRRFTGGGAVYHDEGNLNFTILNRRAGEPLTAIHETNSSYIIAALKKLGLRSECTAPNSVQVNNRKISGAACALSPDYFLWHASILVSTNTDILTRVLSPSRESVRSKYVRSKWSPVTTLNAQLSTPVNVQELSLQLANSIRELAGVEIEPGNLSEIEEKTAVTLYDRKYGLSKWNLNGASGNNGERQA